VFTLLLSIQFTIISGCGQGEASEQAVGAEIHTAIADDNGVASFIDGTTGEDVIIYVVDSETGAPVAGAGVAFFDSDSFEAFQVATSDGAYHPSLEVYPHNSSHTISLTASSLPFFHSTVEGEHADAFADYCLAGASAEHTQYITPDQAETRSDAQLWLLSVSGLGAVINVIGALTEGLGLAEDLGIVAESECYEDSYFFWDVGQENFFAPFRVTVPTDAANCTEGGTDTSGSAVATFTSCSDGSYLFCDDFSGSLADWNFFSTQDSVETVNGWLSFNGYGRIYTDPVSLPQEFTLGLAMYRSTYGLRFSLSDEQAGGSLYVGGDSDGLFVKCYVDGASVDDVEGAAEMVSGEPNIFTIDVSSSGSVATLNGVEVYSGPCSSQALSSASLAIQAESGGGVDYVFLR